VTAAYRLDHVDIYRYDGNFKLAGRIFIDGMPSHLAFDNDSKSVFVTLQQSAKVVAFDLQTQLIKWNAEVGKAPAARSCCPTTSACWSPLTGEDSVVTVDPKDGSIIGRLKTGKGAHNFWPKGDGRHWFLSNRCRRHRVADRHPRHAGSTPPYAFRADPTAWDITPTARSCG
jgi:6-phosphogluconolactonase (cycloisomerase 2 family)